MIGIIVALQNEANGFLNAAGTKIKKEFTNLGKKAYEVSAFGVDAVLCLCGIGKVNAAMATQALIDKFGVSHVLNFGTAGGTTEKVEKLGIYLIDKCCQYDFDVSAIDEKVSVGYIQDYDKVYFSTYTDGIDFLEKVSLATSDHITYTEEHIKMVRDLNCSVYDMEGGAIAETCEANSIPFVLVKGISDTYESGTSDFYENTLILSEKFPPIIYKLLNILSSVTK